MIPRLHSAATVLMVIDVQERLMPAIWEAAQVEKGCVLLAQAARQLGLPIIVTEQYPAKLGRTLPSIMEVVTVVEPLPKLLFSACTTEVLAALKVTGRLTVLLCGVETHVCVLQTTLDLMEQGYSVFVAGDAVSSRRENDKRLGWERMMRAGAWPTSTESAIFELLREAGTPDFKALLPFLK